MGAAAAGCPLPCRRSQLLVELRVRESPLVVLYCAGTRGSTPSRLRASSCLAAWCRPSWRSSWGWEVRWLARSLLCFKLLRFWWPGVAHPGGQAGAGRCAGGPGHCCASSCCAFGGLVSPILEVKLGLGGEQFFCCGMRCICAALEWSLPRDGRGVQEHAASCLAMHSCCLLPAAASPGTAAGGSWRCTCCCCTSPEQCVCLRMCFACAVCLHMLGIRLSSVLAYAWDSPEQCACVRMHLACAGQSYRDFIANMHLPTQLAQVGCLFVVAAQQVALCCYTAVVHCCCTASRSLLLHNSSRGCPWVYPFLRCHCLLL